MRLVFLHLITLLIIGSNVIISWAQVVNKDFFINVEEERDKRAIDFGLFVRNLLLKSSAASDVKANISRNVANLKTTTRAPRRRTTTTTPAPPPTPPPTPFFFNKGPFRFPFDLSGPKFNNLNKGYINFDYNDYGPRPNARRRRPTTTSTTTTTTTTTTTAAPLPPRRRPLNRRPYGLPGKNRIPQFDYYNDDYDYNYDDINQANTPATTPATPAATPNPPPAAPQRPPTPQRARAQGRIPQLRNRLIYQYRQPDDISINNAAAQLEADTASNSQASTDAANNSNNAETSANANDEYADDVYDDDVNNGDDLNANNNNPNTNPQDYNDSSDNSNPNANPNLSNDYGNVNAPSPPAPAQQQPLPPANFNFQGQFNPNGPFNQGQLGVAANGPPGFAPQAGFDYSDFSSQYQPPRSFHGFSPAYY